MIINLMGKMTHPIGKNTLGFILVYCLLSKVTDGLSFLVHVYSPDKKEERKLWIAFLSSFERIRIKI